MAWRQDLRRHIVLVPLGVSADALEAAAAAEAVENSMSATPPAFGATPLGISGPADCAALQQLCYDAAYLRYKACAKNAQAIGVALNAWRERRIRRRVVRAGGQLCTSCGHCLCGLPEIGRCPECGRDYRLEATMMAWAMGGYLTPVTPGKSFMP